MMRTPAFALGLATVTFAVNFWAWALLTPLGPSFADRFGLGPLATSVLVTVPILVGALARVPLGVAADRYGGRAVFAAVCFAGIPPVVFLAYADSYWSLVAGGLLLGVTGAAFAVGVAFVSSWYPPGRRGFALGVYGMGNLGVAVSGFLTPRLTDAWGRPAAFLVVAVALGCCGLAFLAVGREAPDRREPRQARTLLRAAAAERSTRELAAFYALTFGGFVAFGAYLPIYLRLNYDVTITTAATWTAVFAVLATVARPAGGWLSDRHDGVVVLRAALAAVACCAVVVAFTPVLSLTVTMTLALAAALGVGNGAVFAMLGRRLPAELLGSAGGLVGSAGGLGGVFPPIVMGAVYQATGDHAIGLMLLSDVTLAAFVYSLLALRTEPAAGPRDHPPTGRVWGTTDDVDRTWSAPAPR